MLRRSPAAAPLVLLLLALGLGAVVIYGAPGSAPDAQSGQPASIGGPFRLIGPDGAAITEKSFPGKWTLVFFGYTFCPDVCPTTLIDIANAMEALGPRADLVQPLFITVDPARDTPAVLKDYTAHFGGRIIGLSGTPAAIADVEKAYRVYAAERPGENGGPPLFDHSAIIYLMAPSGTMAAYFTAGTSGKDIASGIESAINGEKGAAG